ncbi:hypothetical protein [Reinekea sp. G2M2-21]|uniref:hypothetical protein n=1 Tax=Reinekea sp. G2M2-21 TaxID=2788942 RepID=UPI0018AC4A6F|nr:hypothetical protein [Reinekea sp. G2M2-21]
MEGSGIITPEQRQALAQLQLKVDALAGEPTEKQREKLRSWVDANIAPAYLCHAAEILLEVDQQLYTDTRMRMGEMGY